MNQAQRELTGIPARLDAFEEDRLRTAWLQEHGQERGREWMEAFYSTCPGCGTVQPRNKVGLWTSLGRSGGLWYCGGCGAVLGIAKSWQASLHIVSNVWMEGGMYWGDFAYYDISWPDESVNKLLTGYNRRHGWYDPISRCIVQTG